MNALEHTLPISPKYNYAQAVASGSMTKAAAFTTFINPHSRNPSQGAYRLEQTQYMNKLISVVRKEQELTQSIKSKQLHILERSLIMVDKLLERTDNTAQEQLATLRLVKALTGNVSRADDTLSSDIDAQTPHDNTLNKSQVVM